MRYTLAALALAAALGGGVAWSGATEAPWESEGDTIVVEEVQPAPRELTRCERLFEQLTDARTDTAARLINLEIFQTC
jgi:hypothetical protein